MEVIDTSDTDRFERCVKAGVELVEKLREVLAKHGLGEDEAAGVLLIGSGGILLTSDVTPMQYVTDLIQTCQLWYKEERREGLENLRCVLLNRAELAPGHGTN